LFTSLNYDSDNEEYQEVSIGKFFAPLSEAMNATIREFSAEMDSEYCTPVPRNTSRIPMPSPTKSLQAISVPNNPAQSLRHGAVYPSSAYSELALSASTHADSQGLSRIRAPGQMSRPQFTGTTVPDQASYYSLNNAESIRALEAQLNENAFQSESSRLAPYEEPISLQTTFSAQVVVAQQMQIADLKNHVQFLEARILQMEAFIRSAGLQTVASSSSQGGEIDSAVTEQSTASTAILPTVSFALTQPRAPDALRNETAGKEERVSQANAATGSKPTQSGGPSDLADFPATAKSFLAVAEDSSKSPSVPEKENNPTSREKSRSKPTSETRVPASTAGGSSSTASRKAVIDQTEETISDIEQLSQLMSIGAFGDNAVHSGKTASSPARKAAGGVEIGRQLNNTSRFAKPRAQIYADIAKKIAANDEDEEPSATESTMTGLSSVENSYVSADELSAWGDTTVCTVAELVIRPVLMLHVLQSVLQIEAAYLASNYSNMKTTASR
jgi:hypothetical protein